MGKRTVVKGGSRQSRPCLGLSRRLPLRAGDARGFGDDSAVALVTFVTGRKRIFARPANQRAVGSSGRYLSFGPCWAIGGSLRLPYCPGCVRRSIEGTGRRNRSRLHPSRSHAPANVARDRQDDDHQSWQRRSAATRRSSRQLRHMGRWRDSVLSQRLRCQPNHRAVEAGSSDAVRHHPAQQHPRERRSEGVLVETPISELPALVGGLNNLQEIFCIQSKVSRTGGGTRRKRYCCRGLPPFLNRVPRGGGVFVGGRRR